MTDLAEKAKAILDGGMRCNCDLDNWVPEVDTGHTWVCRIHKAVKEQQRKERQYYERAKVK